MPQALLITVIGKSARDPNDPVPLSALAAAEEVGRLIAEAGAIVVSGGLSGVMEAVSRGAKAAGGTTIGILPGFDKREANRFIDIPITTGMGYMRNTLNVRVADAVIMISGGIGTLNELTVAYEDKPTVILEGTGGWADRMRDVAYKGVHLDEGGRNVLRYTSTPKDAVDLALELARGDERAKRAGDAEFR